MIGSANSVMASASNPRIDPLEIQGTAVGSAIGLPIGLLAGTVLAGQHARPVPWSVIAGSMLMGAAAATAAGAALGLLVGHALDEAQYH